MSKPKRSKSLLYPIAIAIALIAAYAFQGKSDHYLRSRVVKLSNGGHMCSGEQVRAPSGVDYILSAGHCANIATNGYMQVTTEDGKVLQRRVIAEDNDSDLLLLEGLPNMRGLAVAKDAFPKERVRTFTHGGNMATYETDGVLVGDKLIRVLTGYVTSQKEAAECVAKPKYTIMSNGYVMGCILNVEETITTAVIVPGSSGGMVVDSAGRLVGVASATGEGFGCLVRLVDIKQFLSAY